MNAISSIEPSVPSSVGWQDIEQRVNAWRGQCTDLYARVEAAVSDALIALNAVPVRGAAIQIPHLTGHRFAALTEATGTEGAFATEGKSVAKALAAFRKHKHEAFRTCLCHGVATITKDHKNRIYIIFHVLPFLKGQTEREVVVFDETQAEAAMRSLKKDSQRMRDTVARLCMALHQQQDDLTN